MKARTNTAWAAISLLTTVLVLVSNSGCAQIAVNRIVKDYEQRFNTDVGKATKDDYIKQWGPPIRFARVSDGEVCTWRFSYGIRGYASGSEYGAHARAHEMYDEFIFTFDQNGVLKQYRFWVQR